MSDYESTVDVAGLQKSLDDLLKAADATDIKKGDGGINISHSGRNDERGHGGGGLETNTGGLDDMMIGKMIEAGIPFETVDAFVGFMSGKKKVEIDLDADEDEGDEGGEDDEEMEGKRSHYKKSMDYYRQDPALSDAFDVSSALEAFVERNAELHDRLGKSIRGYQGRQENVNTAMAKAMNALGHTVARQSEVIDELGRRLGIVERTPAGAPKGVTTAAAAALHKSMPGEAGVESLVKSFSKSQFCSALTYMNLEKGVKMVAGQPTGQLAAQIEAGASVTPEVFAEVESFLKSNPNEVDKARNYA